MVCCKEEEHSANQIFIILELVDSINVNELLIGGKSALKSVSHVIIWFAEVSQSNIGPVQIQTIMTVGGYVNYCLIEKYNSLLITRSLMKHSSSD